DPAWRGFPDAWLAVPRLCLAVSPAGRWLASSVLVRTGDEPLRLADGLERERDRLIGAGAASESAAVWATIAESFRNRRPSSDEAVAAATAAGVDGDDAAREAFLQAVAEGAAAVRGGALEKVVVARAVGWRPPRPPDAVATLRRLAARYPDCHLFAVARGRRVFLGASPERLVRVDGRMVRATSLAGSIGRGATAELDGRQGAALMASAKDREEHAIVVRALTAALAELGDDVVAPAAPALLTMPDVHHLYTPVTARLRDGVALLDVVARLHPTPAVGGAPRDDALAFIRDHERWDRGWYAAPVGWMDAGGDGEFAVALRSALLDGDRATLFAGCGVMGDSEPGEEYAESELKLRAMRDGLADIQAVDAAGTATVSGAAGEP
ncbi:MAG: isochorismate synthase, partial [Gemmatimonadaceae bacterium]